MLLQWLEFNFFVNYAKQKSLKTLYKTIFMYHFFVIHVSCSLPLSHISILPVVSILPMENTNLLTKWFVWTHVPKKTCCVHFLFLSNKLNLKLAHLPCN